MNAVFAVVILGAVAAASAAAVPLGTSADQQQTERRARQVSAVSFGNNNFSPTVDGAQQNPDKAKQVVGVSFGDDNFSPNVNTHGSGGHSGNSPSSSEPRKPSPTENVPNNSVPSGNQPTCCSPRLPINPPASKSRVRHYVS